MNNYTIGQIFSDKYPPEASGWCNRNNAFIEKAAYGKYIIRAVPETSKKEKAEMRSAELQAYLSNTDWYCARFVDVGVEIPAEVKARRQSAREEIDELRAKLMTAD